MVNDGNTILNVKVKENDVTSRYVGCYSFGNNVLSEQCCCCMMDFNNRDADELFETVLLHVQYVDLNMLRRQRLLAATVDGLK